MKLDVSFKIKLALTLGLFATALVGFGQNFNVTFRVNMNGQTVASEGVKLAGSFNGFSTNLNPMTAVGNNLYETTLQLPVGTYTYKFVNGATFEDGLTTCGVGSTLDRTLSVSASNQILPTVCFGRCDASCLPTYPVTFRVDMTGQTVSPNGVKLAGSFNGFSTTATPMNLVGNNVYEVTIPLQNGTYIFKYVNGSTFETGLTSACGVGATLDRQILVDGAPLGVFPFCFGRCDNNCAPQGFSNVSFIVNMADQVVSPAGVFLAGSFNGFSTTATPMARINDGPIYSATVRLPIGSTVTYKFLNGSNWENIAGSCTVDDGSGNRNRAFSVGNFSTILNPDCFGACGNCPNRNFTFRVNMQNQTVSPQGVKLAGSFNNFSTTSTPMTLISGTTYGVTVSLTPGQRTRYKFVNGSSFENISSGCTVDDGSGNFNRSFIPSGTIGQTTDLPIVCYESCTNCATATYPVTFRVNMTGQTVSSNGVKLAGSFNGFSTTANAMTSVGNNVFESTVWLPSGTYTYKFMNGTNFETGLTACGVGANQDRQVVVGTTAQTLSTVCFGQCNNNCALPQSFPITFRVNMTNQTISPSGVFLAGSFNGFSNTANPMTSVGGGIYEATVSLAAGNYIYKFMNGSNFELIPNTCGVGATLDRSVQITAASTLPTVCFGRCDNNCPQQFATVFRVNMTNQTISPSGVFLAGSFNGFSLSANPMISIGGGVFETTVSLLPGTYTYKFVNGSTLETVPAACGSGPNLERSVQVTAAATLPTVCFGRCDNSCPQQFPITFRVNMTNQTISPSGVFLAGSFNGFSNTANPMTSVGGGIYEATVSLAAGNYIYKFMNGSNFELIPNTCGVGATLDRSVQITAAATLPTVCFGRCDNNCASGTQQVNVTFRVNLTGQTVSPLGVFLAGNFNNFSATATPMNAIGNNTYEVTVPCNINQEQFYRFFNGSFGESLINSACGFPVSGIYYRRVSVINTALALPIVCLNRCDNACGIGPTYMTTFRVNMTGQTVSPQGVFLAGSFNSFSPTTNPMTSAGNNIYELALPLQSGVYTYKFLNGSTFEDNLTNCGVGPTFDRQVVVADMAQNISNVCFGRCDLSCTTVTKADPREVVQLRLFPNPASDWIAVEGLGEKETVNIMNATGKVVEVNMQADKNGKICISVDKIPSGMYWLVSKERRLVFSVQK